VAGNTCSKPRVSAAFNQTTAATGLSGNLNSSMINMTFEVWIKSLVPNTINSSNPQVILQNFDGTNILT